MNEIVRTQRSPVEVFVDEVLPADRLGDLSREMPSHIRPDLFKRNLLNAIMINWDLMKCDAGLLFREVSKAAALGLYLDPALGEAYMIISKGEPQLRIGYRGLTKLARQSGTVAQIYAHEVYQNDFIKCRQGTAKELIHEPVLFGDRGDVIGYYAVITFKDGGFDFEPMSRAQTLEIRDRSDAWKAFKANKIRSTPWGTDEIEMAKKTVIRRLMKRAPQSPELAEALRIEDVAEGYMKDRPLLAPRRVAPSASISAIENKPESPTQMDGRADRDRRPAEKSPEKPVQARRAPSAAAPPAAKQETPSADTLYDPEKVRAKFEAAVKAASDTYKLDDVWNDIIVPIWDDAFPTDQEDWHSIYKLRRAEIDGQEGVGP